MGNWVCLNCNQKNSDHMKFCPVCHHPRALTDALADPQMSRPFSEINQQHPPVRQPVQQMPFPYPTDPAQQPAPAPAPAPLPEAQPAPADFSSVPFSQPRKLAPDGISVPFFEQPPVTPAAQMPPPIPEPAPQTPAPSPEPAPQIPAPSPEPVQQTPPPSQPAPKRPAPNITIPRSIPNSAIPDTPPAPPQPVYYSSGRDAGKKLRIALIAANAACLVLNIIGVIFLIKK